MTDSVILPDFDDFADLLLPLSALNSPAELHGMVCGKLCGGARFSETEWLAAAVEFLDLAQELTGETRQVVAQLYTASLAQLQDDVFGLQLLLPDDDTELAQRADGLGQWCHGFLSGFGSAGIDADRQMSADVADALRDLAAIVQIDTEDSDDDDDDEGNFMEIVEYVRMAVLTLYMECGTNGEPGSQSPTVH